VRDSSLSLATNFSFLNAIRLKRLAERNLFGQSWNLIQHLLTAEFLYISADALFGACSAASGYPFTLCSVRHARRSRIHKEP
jgi:hypothetical protein